MSLIKLPRWLSDNRGTVTGPNPDGSFTHTGPDGTSRASGWAGPNEPLHPAVRRPDIKLDTAEDMEFVQAFVFVIQDDPDAARSIVRDLSAKDWAVLQFHLAELTRIVQEEDEFRTTADRRAARRSSGADSYPDGYDV
jgi:hypothetical protein